MPISTAFLDELRARTLLSSVLAPHVKLIRAGREWKACCPFHKEKTPSFVVNDEKGFYHCFGCGAHGDAIRFLTDHHGMPFMDAVRQLAATAGMKLPDAQPERQQPAVVATHGGQKKGGARLSRSETVTVRLDPKLNYLCELAARAQRRTKSSFIEWAVAEALKSVTLQEVRTSDDFDDPRAASIHETALQLWQVDEADRLAALALMAPSLLTHEEQLIWRLVRENGYVWRGHFGKAGEWLWQVSDQSLIRERLREYWDTFKSVALGDEPTDRLPRWQRRQDEDAEVPF